MLVDLYFSTTPVSFLLIVACTVFENKFLTDEKAQGKNFKITVDLSNTWHGILTGIGFGLLLFAPIINLLFSICYCGWIVYMACKSRNK
jgi:hypothetical protein